MSKLEIDSLDTSELEVIVDISCLLDIYPMLDPTDLYPVQYHAGRLCYILRVAGIKQLELVQEERKKTKVN